MSRQKTKTTPRAARSNRQAAASVKRRAKTLLRGGGVRVERYVVVCTRHDGREREWMHYEKYDEAARIAEHLSSIGCPSRVLDRNEGGDAPGSQ
jgi:hypothetical protein